MKNNMLTKHAPKIILSIIFILTLLINLQVSMYGDDYYYATFVGNDFWNLHKAHYLEVNGRAIVHFLDTLFLAMPLWIWAIFNSLWLTLICHFGSKIVYLASGSKSAYVESLVIFMFGTMTLDIMVVRQSIYWVTGSLNYVYPIFMLFRLGTVLFAKCAPEANLRAPLSFGDAFLSKAPFRFCYVPKRKF